MFALLHSAFRLFDVYGTGCVGRDELDLIFVALDKHTNQAEMSQLLQLLAPEANNEPTIAFHQFLERLVTPAMRHDAKYTPNQLARRLDKLWPSVESHPTREALPKQQPHPDWPLLSAAEVSNAYSVFVSFASWNQLRRSSSTLVPTITEDEVPYARTRYRHFPCSVAFLFYRQLLDGRSHLLCADLDLNCMAMRLIRLSTRHDSCLAASQND